LPFGRTLLAVIHSEIRAAMIDIPSDDVTCLVSLEVRGEVTFNPLR
jgi:hypothetical protein